MTIFHYLNGAFVRGENAFVSALDLGLLRGYGVFDYAQVYGGKIFHLMDHLERLKWSAEQVELSLPMSLEEMQELSEELASKNPQIDAGIRFVLTGGVSGQDQLLPDGAANLVMLFHPFTPPPEKYYTRGMKVITTRMLRSLPGVKTTNYMPAIFATNRAKKMGFDDAVYIDARGGILEGMISNAFFFKNGTLITSDSDQIVKGVTRALILELAKDHFPIEFLSLPLSELKDCEEAFLCSSRKEVAPLVQINDQVIGDGLPGPKCAKLRGLFQDYVKQYQSCRKVATSTLR